MSAKLKGCRILLVAATPSSSGAAQISMLETLPVLREGELVLSVEIDEIGYCFLCV